MNIFAAEDAIVARIKAQVAGFTHVGTINSLAGYTDVADLLPAAIVLPGESSVGDGPSDGAIQTETQMWQVVVMVGHSHDAADDTTTVQRAGVLGYQVMQALLGWRPAQGFSYMAYRGRQEPYFEPGYGEFPLLFDTVLTVVGSGN